MDGTGDDAWDGLEKLVNLIRTSLEHLRPPRLERLKARIAVDLRQRHLRKRGRADLHHLALNKGVTIFRKGGRNAAVEHFDPAAACARPWHVLGHAAQRKAGNIVAHDLREELRGGAVEHDVCVCLVANDEKPVFARDSDDCAQRLLGIHRSGGIVGIDKHERNHLRIVFDLVLDLLQVRRPALLRIETKLQMRVVAALALVRGVRRV